MALTVPGPHLFTNEINMAISRASRSSRLVQLCSPLWVQIEHWLFLDPWEGFLPWRSERRRHVQLCSDAPSFAWGVVLGPETISVFASDYWSDSHLHFDIATKEALALANVLESFASWISQLGIDKVPDLVLYLMPSSEYFLRSFHPMFRKSPLYPFLVQSRWFSIASLIPYGYLAFADGLGQSAPHVWRRSWPLSRLNGPYLKCLVWPFWLAPSNFSPYPTPGCAGVNMFAQYPASHSPALFCNPYAFPPIALIPSVFFFFPALWLFLMFIQGGFGSLCFGLRPPNVVL